MAMLMTIMLMTIKVLMMVVMLHVSSTKIVFTDGSINDYK